MIRLEGVSCGYPSFLAGPFDHEFANGITGVIGPNGAGKTTLFSAIGGLLDLRAGAICIDGGPPLDELERRRAIASYSGRDMWYGGLTIAQQLAFLSAFFPSWDHALATTLLDRFRLDPAKRVAGLSSGMQVKLALIAAMARRPAALLFDEPWNSLDPAARHELSAIIRELDDGTRTIVVSSHDLAYVESVCSALVIIDHGRIVRSGTTPAICGPRRAEPTGLTAAFLDATVGR
jgi:ABC-2 type transport system ATP-binding protein